MQIDIKVIGGFLPEWTGGGGDAGLDLRASEDIVLRAAHEFDRVFNYSTEEFETVPIIPNVVIPLGIQTSFGGNMVALIKDRSSLASKCIYTSGGVIDSSYRGEWKILIRNESTADFKICRGDRIAQVLFLPVFHLNIIEVNSLTATQRGTGGFGSTGK